MLLNFFSLVSDAPCKFSKLTLPKFTNFQPFFCLAPQEMSSEAVFLVVCDPSLNELWAA
jgi:hypothetical protein